MESRKLFTPLQVGNMSLSHRIVMCPLTRTRCPNGFPTPLVAEYYSQRATLGGLLISEGVMPSFMAGNLLDVPGIYTQEHIEAWKLVTNAVHAKGAFIACQLWHTGRFAVSVQLGGKQPLSASATNCNATNRFTPLGRVPSETAKAMTEDEVEETIKEHVHAAKCAVEAGFDCVEITSGNGYLLDQFLNSGTNLRYDQYGGAIENRARFTLKLLDAVVNEIGKERTAVRFSPFGTVLMPLDKNPVALFTYVLKEVEKRGLAYVSLTQPRADLFLSESVKLALIQSKMEDGSVSLRKEEISLKPFTSILRTTPVIATGGYNAKNCFEEVEKGELDAVSFGKYFISNPDLVDRLRSGWPLSPYDPSTFYAVGKKGYTDHPSIAEAESRGLVWS